MDQIASKFAENFSNWNIRLPVENLQARTAGYMAEAGWLIQFCFGHDEQGGYLDYYASHRMTDDSHVRIYADGSTRELDAMETMFVSSDDPDEAKRLEEEFFRKNREIQAALIAKGFTRATVNMYLSTAPDELGREN